MPVPGWRDMISVDGFGKGDRVRLGKEWTKRYEHYGRNELRLGTVVGFSREKTHIWIRWDGNAPSSIECFSPAYLEKLDA